jgi:hypothetical protein
MDPDCFGRYNDIYCQDIVSPEGSNLPTPWASGVICSIKNGSSFCDFNYVVTNPEECEGLPPTSPAALALPGYHPREAPPEWSCDPLRYWDGNICDCGCGVIDPDCGYQLRSCDDQTWNPAYTQIFCNGLQSPTDLIYCRLETASCTTLPPGLARGAQSKWTCIPEVFNEISINEFDYDCNCACGVMDPDCLYDFNQIVCDGGVEVGTVRYPRNQGINCRMGPDSVYCEGVVYSKFEFPEGIKQTVIALVSISISFCVIVLTLIFKYRSYPSVQSNGFVFSALSIAGAVLFCLSPLLFVVELTSPVCTLRNWALPLSFNLMFGPYFFNTYRILHIFHAQDNQVEKLTDSKLIFRVGLFFLGQVGINCASGEGGYSMSESSVCHYMQINPHEMSYYNCCSVTASHIISSFIYEGLLLFWGIQLASASRKLPERFNNSSPIAAVLVFNICYLSVFLPVDILIPNNSPAILVWLRCMGIFVGVWLSLVFIFIPRLLQAWDYQTSLSVKTRPPDGVDSPEQREANKSSEFSGDSYERNTTPPSLHSSLPVTAGDDARVAKVQGSQPPSVEMENYPRPPSTDAENAVNLILNLDQKSIERCKKPRMHPRPSRKKTGQLQHLEHLLNLRLQATNNAPPATETKSTCQSEVSGSIPESQCPQP